MLAQSVIQEIIQNPALREYLVAFQEGDALCTEGDESKDLFILLSGRLAFFRGDKKITEVAEEGTPVGEISFLLKSKRTATVKALGEVQAIRIPQNKLERFLEKFPALMWRISEVLARRLNTGTQVWHALKEFCDNVPDAVVAAEADGRITTWNRRAESLFGRSWEQMQAGDIGSLYRDPEQYRRAIGALEKSHAVKEKVFAVDHPQKGCRYVSTSLNFLYDGKNDISGVLALSRDVTDWEKIKRSYRRIRFWMLPILVAAGVAVGASFFAVPYFKDRSRISDVQHQALRDRLANDYFLLQALLAASLAQGDAQAIDRVLRQFVQRRQPSSEIYSGIALLGNDQRVLAAYAMAEKEIKADMIGISYAGIPFEVIEDSNHSVLSLYWSKDRAAFGQKGIELAFEIKHDNRPVGWLIFQMDTARLTQDYAADEALLKAYKFN